MKTLSRITAFLVLNFVIVNSIFGQAIIDSKLTKALSNNSLVEVVVTFKGTGAPNLSQVTLLRTIGISKGITFRALPIAGVLATKKQVEALAKNSQIRSLYLNSKLKYTNYNSRALTGVDRLRSDQVITTKNKGIPVSGNGISVLINDSGVDGTHSDLKYGTHLIQNTLGSTNLQAIDDLLPVTYIEGIPNTDNNSGHGTHCAGIVGGTGQMSAGKYAGVAPGANLLGYGSGAALFVLDGVGGFDYAITHQAQYKIRVITNSWGSSGSFDPNDPVNVASKAAYDRNIVVLFAAGNSGPGESTNTPYAAPWVITVAAGDKDGKLADFSSRGLNGQAFDFELDGKTWHYENRPTITAPGVNIVSTRVIAPVSSLGAPDDTSLEPGYIPFYTTMSGTSMATPHTAGIVALLLEANQSLTCDDVKRILQETATNMPGYQSWEVGAGYVNAYAAVDDVFRSPGYGFFLNAFKTYNANANFETTTTPFKIDYVTTSELSTDDNKFKFNVAAGMTVINSKIDAEGFIGSGNPINLVLIAPDGTEYSSGVSLLFAIEFERSVTVANPMPGEWTVEIRGLRGDPANPTSGAGIPEEVSGYVKISKPLGFTGLNDIAGNSAAASIEIAVSQRLLDSDPDGNFRPNNPLSRLDLARFLVMGQAIRQYMPTDGSIIVTDLERGNKVITEAVTARGAALRDRMQKQKGVMLLTEAGTFSPDNAVTRFSLAYSLVQALGLEDSALARNGKPVTVNLNGQDILIDDAGQIPAGFEGYVQIALNMNLINAYFSLTQGPNDLQPTIHASFKATQPVTRGEFAVIVTRTHSQWTAGSLPKSNADENITAQPITYKLDQNFPNPFNPSTMINFSIPNDGMVTLDIYNAIGERVMTLVNEVKTAGTYQVNFNAAGLSSGIYIYRITAGNFVETKKMTLLK